MKITVCGFSWEPRGGTGFPLCAICKLETQETACSCRLGVELRCWCSSSLSPKAWEPEQQWWKFQIKGRGRSMSQVKQAERKKKNISTFFAFLFYWGRQWAGWGPGTLGRASFCTQFTHTSAHLFQKHHHRHSQKCLTTSGHSVAQLSWHIKSTITISNIVMIYLYRYKMHI